MSEIPIEPDQSPPVYRLFCNSFVKVDEVISCREFIFAHLWF